MKPYMLRVICRAAKTRVSRGESIDDVLASWPQLTPEEQAEVRKYVSEH